MTLRTRAQLKSDAASNLPDNTSAEISPADVRGQFDNVADSAVLPEDLKVASLAALISLNETKYPLVDVTGSPDEGLFCWDGSDLSAKTVVQSVTSTGVNSGTETITKTAHGLITGDGVVATTAVNGLSLNTVYWVIKVDANNFKLASSLANLQAGTAFNLTGTTNFTVKQLRDPRQRVWVIKSGAALDGTAGAWVRVGADLGGTHNTAGQRFHRLNDRLLVGQGATMYSGYEADVPYGIGSWLHNERGTTGSEVIGLNYLLINSVGAFIGSPLGTGAPYGVLGASKVPEGATIGILVGSGGDSTVNGTLYDADVGLRFINNGAKFRVGIVFDDDALARDGNGFGEAVSMIRKDMVSWYYGTGGKGFLITSDVSDSAHAMQWSVGDTGAFLFNTAGKIISGVGYVASAVNFVYEAPAVSGSNPAFYAAGDGTNLSLGLNGKGTGGVILSDGGGASKFAVNTTGIGFFAATPVARGALAAPSGTITRTTFATSSVTLPQLAERVYAIINDLRAYGLFS